MPSGVPLDPDYWKKYYQNNKEKILAYERAWRNENHAKINQNRKNNPLILANRTANQKKREAIKQKACPIWANLVLIELQYIKAKLMEWLTSDKYHVDHIIPLQGENVCGLHVEYNLQILPAIENIKKSNRIIGE